MFPYKEDQVAPIQRGKVIDWNHLQKQWLQIADEELGITRKRIEYTVLFLVPPCWGHDDLELVTKFFFEQVNVAGLVFYPHAIAAILGANAVTGLVVDIGYETTTVVPIYDTVPIRGAIRSAAWGTKDILNRFWALAQASSDAPLVYEPRLHRAIFDQCILEASLPSKPIQEAVSCSLSSDRTAQVGPYRATAVELLFHFPSESSLTDLILASLEAVDPTLRLNVLDSIVLTGSGTHIKHVRERLEYELNQSLITMGSNIGELQPRELKFKEIPEYLEAYKNRPELISYLGASLLAKISFADSKSHITRDDYDANGPSIIFHKSYGGISV